MRVIKQMCNLTLLSIAMILIAGCDSDSDSIHIEEPKAPGVVNGNQSINFTWSNGAYTYSRMSSDFGNASNYSNAEKDRCYVIDNRLKVTLLKNALSGAGGVIVDVDINKSDEYILKYDIKFHSQFEWSRGGKLPGLGGGAAYAGGTPATAGDGWSFRVMWRQGSETNNGVPYLIPYVYYVDQPGSTGDNFGSSARFNIQKNQWYTVQIRAKMNTGSNSDGLIEMKVNNTIVYRDTSFRWATQTDGREVDLLLWRFFRGGSTPDWEASTDSYIYIDNVTLNKL